MYNWNDFLWPLIMTTSVDKRTLPAGLALFMGQHVIEYAILMAGAAISLAPLLIAFLFAQEYFVQGIALTGLKE
jgi:multiple sugar transport system permease protein